MHLNINFTFNDLEIFHMQCGMEPANTEMNYYGVF